MKIFSKAVPGSNLMFMRGEGTIAAHAEDVYLCTFAMEDRPKWDKMFEKGTVLENLTPTIRISYMQFKGAHV